MRAGPWFLMVEPSISGFGHVKPEDLPLDVPRPRVWNVVGDSLGHPGAERWSLHLVSTLGPRIREIKPVQLYIYMQMAW
jgi:hypothetical protein